MRIASGKRTTPHAKPRDAVSGRFVRSIERMPPLHRVVGVPRAAPRGADAAEVDEMAISVPHAMALASLRRSLAKPLQSPQPLSLAWNRRCAPRWPHDGEAHFV